MGTSHKMRHMSLYVPDTVRLSSKDLARLLLGEPSSSLFSVLKNITNVVVTRKTTPKKFINSSKLKLNENVSLSFDFLILL
jgi:hypothetical protein